MHLVEKEIKLRQLNQDLEKLQAEVMNKKFEKDRLETEIRDSKKTWFDKSGIYIVKVVDTHGVFRGDDIDQYRLAVISWYQGELYRIFKNVHLTDNFSSNESTNTKYVSEHSIKAADYELVVELTEKDLAEWFRWLVKGK